jgi:hypothetical protein
MTTISFARHLFLPAIIRHTVWLYLRFTLSYRDVEDLLAERGLDVSYESVRQWVLKFGPLFARQLRCKRHRPTSQWHLDEMAAQRVEELGALRHGSSRTLFCIDRKSCVGRLLRLDRRESDGVHNVIHQRAARQIIHGLA